MEIKSDEGRQAQVARAEFLRKIEKELHDLCQPVTSLQCRLELGKIGGSLKDLLEAANGALEDADRIFACVARMRARLLAEDAGDLSSGEVGTDGSA